MGNFIKGWLVEHHQVSRVDDRLHTAISPKNVATRRVIASSHSDRQTWALAKDTATKMPANPRPRNGPRLLARRVPPRDESCDGGTPEPFFGLSAPHPRSRESSHIDANTSGRLDP